MNSLTKYILIGVVSLILIIVLGVTIWNYFENQPKQYEKTVIDYSKDAQNKNPFIIPKELNGTEFTPLSNSQPPSFITNLKDVEDVKVGFHYEGDYKSNMDAPYPPAPYTLEGTQEHFISISKIKNRSDELAYGPEDFEIFKSEGSHSYQGTPIYISNPKTDYSVAYIGLNINNLNLISSMRIEFGIDYLAERQDAYSQKTSSIFNSIFGVRTAYACGPGTYLRNVGNSNLTFVEESNGTAWYRLDKPVALYNLSLSYCGTPVPSYCHNLADGEPPECNNACYYDASISSLETGALRMHIFYKPNDQEGLLRIQMANFILADQTGQHYQAKMGENFDHYYRAYLH